MGALPINVEAELIDAAAGACHKWLLTPEGVGLLYLSERARERIEPTLVGWMSVPDPEDYGNFEQELGARRSRLGNGHGAHGDHSRTRSQPESVAGNGHRAHCRPPDRVDRLPVRTPASRDYEIISSRRAGEKSQIVCIEHRAASGHRWRFISHLKKQNIIAAPRGTRLRISPHLYNTTEDIDALLGALP